VASTNNLSFNRTTASGTIYSLEYITIVLNRAVSTVARTLEWCSDQESVYPEIALKTFALRGFR